jgi:hypothetical protein
MNDHGFTDADYIHNEAYKKTGEVGGEEYHEVGRPLYDLSFPELMEQCGIPRMDDDDVQWLISKGWRDASVTEYMTAECFHYIRMLIEDGFVSFSDDKAVILECMYDYPSVGEWRDSQLLDPPLA